MNLEHLIARLLNGVPSIVGQTLGVSRNVESLLQEGRGDVVWVMHNCDGGLACSHTWDTFAGKGKGIAHTNLNLSNPAQPLLDAIHLFVLGSLDLLELGIEGGLDLANLLLNSARAIRLLAPGIPRYTRGCIINSTQLYARSSPGFVPTKAFLHT